MGGGKKDKRIDPAKIQAKKARQAAKQQKETQKRTKKEIKDSGEKDIEAILAEFSAKEAAKLAVSINVVPQPSRRANFSMTALTSGEMLLFGGEVLLDENTTVVYNDLFKWNVERNEWKQIESLNTPPPRCSHQAVQFQDKLYVFGGEYGTIDQFYHYRDFWELDLKTNMWKEVEATGDWPSARSGHRMIIWRNYIILFGGFYEAMREVRWYNDLYFYSITEHRWIQINYKTNAMLPKPRSGHQMFVHQGEDLIYIFGGYSKEKQSSSGGGGGGGSKQESVIHEDMWVLNLKPLIANVANVRTGLLDWNKLAWQRIARKGETPSPRCGSVVTVYKNKALLFGGVYDVEGPRHSIFSTFYNDLFAFDMDRRRWYKLGLKEKKKVSGKVGKQSAKKPKDEDEEEDEGMGRDHDESDSDEEDQIIINAAGERQILRNMKRLHEEENDQEENEEMGGGRGFFGLKKRVELFGYIDESGEVVYLQLEEEEEEEKAVEVEIERTSIAVAQIGLGEDGNLTESQQLDSLEQSLSPATIDDSANLPAPPDIATITPHTINTSDASLSSSVLLPPAPTISSRKLQVSVVSHQKPSVATIATAVSSTQNPTINILPKTSEEFMQYFLAAQLPCPRINPCVMIR
jgi:N-acetylneuraminic acid mutarotase